MTRRRLLILGLALAAAAGAMVTVEAPDTARASHTKAGHTWTTDGWTATPVHIPAIYQHENSWVCKRSTCQSTDVNDGAGAVLGATGRSYCYPSTADISDGCGHASEGGWVAAVPVHRHSKNKVHVAAKTTYDCTGPTGHDPKTGVTSAHYCGHWTPTPTTTEADDDPPTTTEADDDPPTTTDPTPTTAPPAPATTRPPSPNPTCNWQWSASTPRDRLIPFAQAAQPAYGYTVQAAAADAPDWALPRVTPNRIDARVGADAVPAAFNINIDRTRHRFTYAANCGTVLSELLDVEITFTGGGTPTLGRPASPHPDGDPKTNCYPNASRWSYRRTVNTSGDWWKACAGALNLKFATAPAAGATMKVELTWRVTGARWGTGTSPDPTCRRRPPYYRSPCVEVKRSMTVFIGANPCDSHSSAAEIKDRLSRLDDQPIPVGGGSSSNPIWHNKWLPGVKQPGAAVEPGKAPPPGRVFAGRVFDATRRPHPANVEVYLPSAPLWVDGDNGPAVTVANTVNGHECGSAEYHLEALEWQVALAPAGVFEIRRVTTSGMGDWYLSRRREYAYENRRCTLRFYSSRWSTSRYLLQGDRYHYNNNIYRRRQCIGTFWLSASDYDCDAEPAPEWTARFRVRAVYEVVYNPHASSGSITPVPETESTYWRGGVTVGTGCTRPVG